jgi:hypothetical protein
MHKILIKIVRLLSKITAHEKNYWRCISIVAGLQQE